MTPNISLIFSKEEHPTLSFSRPNFLTPLPPESVNITEVVFRKANNTDLPGILRLFKQCILHSCHKHYTPTQLRVWTASVQDASKWLKRIEEDYFLVAEADGKLVGMASLKDTDYIDIMFVHHQYQGKGIAKKLLSEVLEKARIVGGESVYTNASITAKPFFNGQGFKAVKANQNIIGNQILINYRMLLDL